MPISRSTARSTARAASAADRPDGPFTLVGPALTEAKFDAEDPYFWYDRSRDRYYAIVKDHDAPFLTPHGRSLLLFESPDGRAWKPAKHSLVKNFSIRWNDGTRQKFMDKLKS